MEKFKNNFYPKKDGREVVSNIFPNEGRGAFSKKVEETFDWSQKGGPRIGTPLFIKDVVGKVSLTSEELSVLKKEIKKEINKIKKRRDEINKENILKENKKQEQERKNKDRDILEGAKKNLEEELDRSGGIDPNDI